jgi:hypothetical protein
MHDRRTCPRGPSYRKVAIAYIGPWSNGGGPRTIASTAGEASLLSLYPVQYVVNDRPAWLALDGLLSQNPVAVKGVDRAVAAPQFDPGIDEMGQVLIAPSQRIRHWNTAECRF